MRCLAFPVLKRSAMLVLPLTLALPPSAGGYVVISEVCYDPEDEYAEWVELFNPGPSEVNLKDYALRDNQWEWVITDEDHILPPGGVVVIAKEAGAFESEFGFLPEFWGFTFKLSNTGDKLWLLDPGGNKVDFVAWEGYGWDLVADEGESIQRWSLGRGPAFWLSHRAPNPGDPAPIPEPGTLLMAALGVAAALLFKANFKGRGC
mgnify:CR=1 FL=1